MLPPFLAAPWPPPRYLASFLDKYLCPPNRGRTGRLRSRGFPLLARLACPLASGLGVVVRAPVSAAGAPPPAWESLVPFASRSSPPSSTPVQAPSILSTPPLPCPQPSPSPPLQNGLPSSVPISRLPPHLPTDRAGSRGQPVHSLFQHQVASHAKTPSSSWKASPHLSSRSFSPGCPPSSRSVICLRGLLAPGPLLACKCG